MVLVIPSNAENEDDAIRSTEKRAHERSDRSHVRMLHCNHAELTIFLIKMDLSVVAAFALAFVSSSYTIRGSIRVARYKTLIGAYCNISQISPKMSRDSHELCICSEGSVGMSAPVLDVRLVAVAGLSIRLIFAFKLYTSCAVTAGLYRCCNNSSTCFGVLPSLNACLASSTASVGNCLRLG